MSREEQLKLEHTTLMEQYKSTRNEIESLLVASRQVANMTLMILSLILGASVFIEAKLPIALLILPFFLYGMVWIQLRYILLMRRASAYIAEAIAPRVRGILKEIFPEKAIETEHILNWEERWQSPGRRKSGVLLLPVLGANYGLPLFAALLFLVVYIFSVSVISSTGWILIGINMLAQIYSIVLGFLVEFRRLGQEYQYAKPKEPQC